MNLKALRSALIFLFISFTFSLTAQDDFLDGLSVLDKALYYDMEGEDPAKAEALVQEYLSEKYNFVTYTVKAGETYWDISERTLGDRFAWPLIWFLNRSKYPDPDVLLPGSAILIPELK